MTRTLLSTLLLAACSVLATQAQAQTAATMRLAPKPQAKNIIFFLGDGMGPTTITAARIYKAGEDGLLDFERLDRTARIKTYSADAQVTDSAPSMGAYMTGVKINNDVISMKDAKPVAPSKDGNGNLSIDRCGAANGSSPMTILELAKAAGKSVGAVTTTELTHATPASTFSHVCDRDMAYTIAQQVVPGGAGFNPRLKDGVDVLMGGGATTSRLSMPSATRRAAATGATWWPNWKGRAISSPTPVPTWPPAVLVKNSSACTAPRAISITPRSAAWSSRPWPR